MWQNPLYETVLHQRIFHKYIAAYGTIYKYVIWPAPTIQDHTSILFTCRVVESIMSNKKIKCFIHLSALPQIFHWEQCTVGSALYLLWAKTVICPGYLYCLIPATHKRRHLSMQLVPLVSQSKSHNHLQLDKSWQNQIFNLLWMFIYKLKWC